MKRKLLNIRGEDQESQKREKECLTMLLLSQIKRKAETIRNLKSYAKNLRKEREKRKTETMQQVYLMMSAATPAALTFALPFLV